MIKLQEFKGKVSGSVYFEGIINKLPFSNNLDKTSIC